MPRTKKEPVEKTVENRIPDVPSTNIPFEQQYYPIYTAFLSNNECKKLLKDYGLDTWEITCATHSTNDDNEPSFFITFNQFQKKMWWWWRNEELNNHNTIYWLNTIQNWIKRIARQMKKEALQQQDQPPQSEQKDVQPQSEKSSTDAPITREKALSIIEEIPSRWILDDIVSRTLPVPLTNEETLEIKDTILQLLDEQEDVANAAAASARGYKDKIAGIRAKYNELRDLLEEGTKREPIPCSRYKDTTNHQWEVRRNDTQEVIEHYPWTQEEIKAYQELPIPFPDAVEQSEATQPAITTKTKRTKKSKLENSNA